METKKTMTMMNKTYTFYDKGENHMEHWNILEHKKLCKF